MGFPKRSIVLCKVDSTKMAGNGVYLQDISYNIFLVGSTENKVLSSL